MKTNTTDDKRNKSAALLRGAGAARGAMLAASLAILFFAMSASAHADLVRYRVVWVGTPFGNTAAAEAIIAIETSLVPNPGTVGAGGTPIAGSFIKSINMTVKGASAGNGTFVTSDFGSVYWDTNGGTLDLNVRLAGQATSGSPWGSIPNGGDFNLGSAANGPPTGASAFVLATNSGGPGDLMRMAFIVPIYADVRLGTTAAAVVGNNIYMIEQPLGQTLGVAISRGGGVRTVYIRIQNDGPTASAIKVIGEKGNAQFGIRYFNGAANVTAKVVAGTFNTGVLAPGASRLLKAVITAKTPAAGRFRAFAVMAASVIETYTSDIALIRARSK